MTVSDYATFARSLTDSGLITDPWIDGRPRFDAGAHWLTPADHAALAAAAESVAGVLDELCHIVHRAPGLLDDFFAMTPVQKLMWQASAPMWHGLARADVFLRDGAPSGADATPRAGATPVVCEVNCDTPSGLAEAVCLGDHAAAEGFVDLNRDLGPRFAALLARFAGREGALTVGIVYPTELTDDLGLIALYRRWCEALGAEVVLGSPYNLQPLPGDGVAMFGRRLDLVLRHYKTDWWGERLPIRDDEAPFPDPDPLTGPLTALLAAELAGQVSVLNPFGAVLPQNKRAFAFCWEELHRFSPEAQAVIRDTIPFTQRLEQADRAQLLAEREAWVLKTDYGCEGEEVVIGRETLAEVWADVLAHALPERWVAQRYFDARRDGAGCIANHGVFLVAGCAAGLYTRVSPVATDAGAISIAAVVAP